MNRDEAIKMIKEDILNDPWQSHCEEAIKMAIAALETLELLGKVLDRLVSPYQLSDPYRDGQDYAYENVKEWLTDPAALHAEAQRLGIEGKE